MTHEIVIDGAGFNQNRPRITCTTCNHTILRQPYMDDFYWHLTVEGFQFLHPSEIVDAYVKELENAPTKR